MTDSQPANELLAITNNLKEHARYYAELGVELVEPAVAGAEPTTAPATTVLTRPAAATSTASSPLSTSKRPNQLSPSAALFQDLSIETEELTRSNETFEAIHAEIGDCTRCPLHARRTNVVHTEGNRKARLMFVGEAPGADEDVQARPFVGRAGQLLTKIIEAIGFKREEVLIGNINRCRPPGNRPPTPEEVTECKPFLLREIASVQPEVIVVLGNTATRNLLETKQGITRLRGNFQDYRGVPVMPTFHPAYLLRDPSKKRETWDDLKKVRDFLDNKKSSSK